MLLWVEGFESFASAAGNAPTGLGGKYIVVNGNTTTLQTGRAQGLGLRIHDAAANPTIQTPSFGNIDTWIIGFGFRPGSALADVRIFEIMDSSTVQFALYMTSAGNLQVRRGTTALETSAATPLAPDTWVYLELKVVISNTGSYEVRASGTTILSNTGDTQNSANAYAQAVKLWGRAGGAGTSAHTFDDLYIADDSAGEITNFIGSHRAITLYPNAEGDLVEWTPSTGMDNSAMVDETPHDSDTTYVESSTTGQQDLYQFQNADLVQIAGVQINAVCRETDATPFSIKLVAKSGTTTDEGSGVAVGTTSYVTRSRVLEVDPDTTVPWIDAGIDAAQFGIEIV